MATQTPMWRDVSAKKKDMFARHGVAMLNLKQVAQEFGCKDERTAKKELEALAVPGISVGRRVLYEVDVLAKALVARRGMN
ncbi:hypothetical protein [Pseudoflavonifractor sp. An85]|uniref:hypothetical protein n=1 Tax=Pseudoflavonifractor sp. An85 TaxID=1965661 RepID=UPI00117AFC44|nr:hypothetical protein [Pseudoflavonifractor sp. An85]